MINNQNIGVLSEKVAHLESDVKTLALPAVETTDEGKALVVNASGKWEAIKIDAENVSYDNSDSGLTADNTQGAIDELTTRSKVELESGTDYNTFVSHTFKKEFVEKNGVVVCTFSFSIKVFTQIGGWKSIFKIPSGYSYPAEDTNIALVTSSGNFSRILVTTTGDIQIDTNYANPTADSLLNFQIMYIK